MVSLLIVGIYRYMMKRDSLIDSIIQITSIYHTLPTQVVLDLFKLFLGNHRMSFSSLVVLFSILAAECQSKAVKPSIGSVGPHFAVNVNVSSF